MKKLLALLVAALALNGAAGRYNHVVTVISGTPVQVTTSSVVISRMMIQALHGSSAAIVYVCIVPLGTTPHASCGTDGELSGEIGPSSSAAPGGTWSDGVNVANDQLVDLRTVWIDGGHSNDTVLITGWRQR